MLMGGMMELLGLFDVASLVGTVGAGEDKVLFALIGGVLCGLSLPMMLSIRGVDGRLGHSCAFAPKDTSAEQTPCASFFT